MPILCRFCAYRTIRNTTTEPREIIMPSQRSPIEPTAYALFVGSLRGGCMHAGGAIGPYMPVPQFDPCTTAGAHFNLNSRADTTELRRRSPNPNKATLKPSKPPAYSVTAFAISAYGRKTAIPS